ncbi:MAG: NAD(+) kinase [Magnetococcales bacterium]|nr:NAD(+) kinase [Magnetococcales bacterium]
MTFDTIGIITKRSDPKALKATEDLTTWLQRRGHTVTVTEEVGRAANVTDRTVTRPQEEIAHGQDLMIVIGGDGTFIAAARIIDAHSTPLLGINRGRLGFLTEIPTDTMFADLEDVLAGRYRIEDRMMLSVSVVRDGNVIYRRRALNDAVVHIGALARMLEFVVAIDDQFVFRSRADGLIVATPTGSTAYALSAGGPIMHPALDAILLVPVCPHTLTNRPIAVPGDGCVEINVMPQDVSQLLTLDGQQGCSLQEEDRILIRRSVHSLKVLHSPNKNHYDVLRRKLSWGEIPENDIPPLGQPIRK